MPNRVTDQAAFILHRRDYQESSLVLELFSEHFGRISVLVKGAKKRRDAASFQLFNRLSVGWSGKSDLKILTHAESRSLKLIERYMPSAFYINELLLYLLPAHQPQPEVFHAYQHFLLSLIDSHTNLEVELRNFEIDLMTTMGYMPELSIDTVSGSKINGQDYYLFRNTVGLTKVSELSGEAVFRGDDILAIDQRCFNNKQVLNAAKRLMRQIIDFNLQGRTLQSRKFYQQLIKR